MKFKVDPQIAEYMPQTDAICDVELEKELVKDGGPRDKLLVAELPDEERFLFDGHRRYRICERLGLPFDTEVFHFATRNEVFDFMDRLALVRRNLTPQQLSLIRGRQVKRMNGKVSAAVSAVAKEHGVSERSVYRDMEYAEAVDSLDPEVKKGVIDMPKKDAVRMSSKPKDEQERELKAKPARKDKPDKSTLSGAMAIAGESCARLQNQLADVHKVVADAIRLKTAKGYVKKVGDLLDKWGEA